VYSVHQHWDPLKVCIVGKSYSPKFYDYISDKNIRSVFYKIAEETEEDYQKLIELLTSFNVQILRPDVSDNYTDYLEYGKILPPPMTPRDISAMIGNNFYIDINDLKHSWEKMRGVDWPVNYPKNFEDIPAFVLDELKSFNFTWRKENLSYNSILKHIEKHSNIIYDKNINSAMTTRVGKDLYFGTSAPFQDTGSVKNKADMLFPEYRCHVVNTEGHTDSSFCPVIPGLIVSLEDLPSYELTFPNWEVVYLPNQSWDQVLPFLQLKEKNYGKWWVPGQELNNDFTNFVEKWLTHWVGFVEETVFDVNMLVIDQKNVVCNNYNQKVFDAFARYGITPHIINFRHRYFWDGGLHCITSDVHREGTMQNYFPERG